MEELRRSYNFFIKERNNKHSSKGYGLIRDKTVISKNVASIASVGYGLAAFVIGVEHNWLEYEEAYNMANRTLDTILHNVENINGFYYHFINIHNGKREWKCEVSIIDTAILLCGAITAGEYFGEQVKEKAIELYKNVNWQWYVDNEKNYFYMGYTPENGFWQYWDMYAEQLMLYVLGVASPTFPIDKSMYDEFRKEKADYKDIKNIIYTYNGSLFTYQFSHAWIDFRNIIDANGIDWFENSIKATKANRQYCIDNKDKYKTYGENSWGITPCLTPKGYLSGSGAMPCIADLEIENDGTISPCAAIGSIVFTPNESMKAMENYYNNFPKLWGEYGFKDGYNLEGKKEWYAKEYIGIDKGIGMIMIENYLNETIWKYFMKNEYIKNGMRLLQFVDKKEKLCYNNHT